MSFRVQESYDTRYIEGDVADFIIRTEQDILELIAGCVEHDTRNVLLYEANFSPEFFDLKTTLAGIVEIRVGRALDTLPQLVTEGRGPFDLVFIDADKPNNAAYFDWAIKLTRPGSLIIADNVVRNGAVIETASEDPSVQGIRRFNERLAAEPRVTATAIQTVGSKGYDGLVIALVTGLASGD